MGGTHGEEAHQLYNGGDGSLMEHARYYFMFESYDLLHALAV